jgi:hypothetical protein
MENGSESGTGSGLRLAAVQFVFALGWTVYVVFLPELLQRAGIAASWLPLLLMADQAIFALMDVAFGLMADRMERAWQRFARAVLALSTLSALAFLALPWFGGGHPALLLAVMSLWVFSASVVRAPTLVLLAKQARAAQRPGLVVWYSAGMALAAAVAPFVGLGLKGADPYLPFALSGGVLWLAVYALLRWQRTLPESGEAAIPPLAFSRYLPLLLGLAVASFGLQVHAFVNAGPLFLRLVEAGLLPWLMPWLWVGFSLAMPLVGTLCSRFGSLPLVAAGLALCAVAIQSSVAVDVVSGLVLLQLLAGFAWGLAFAGLLTYASAAGMRGAEGLFMGSFFAATAVAAVARIAFTSQWLPALVTVRFVLPALCLLCAGGLVLLMVRRLPDHR